MSNPTSSIATSKSLNTTKTALSPSQSGSVAQFQASLSGLDHQRRGGGSTFGAATSTKSAATPRNNQGTKKQNKNTKRFARLGDEEDDAFAELSNMRSGRKGQNITHLMNYTAPSSYYAQSQRHHNSNHRHQIRRHPTWGPGSGYHAADKARFVNANYRFIVDPRCDYRLQSLDADVHLDWSNVLQILISSQSQAASCPICLGTPVAPRMARCGHIFCMPCLIRYMHSDDDTLTPITVRRARSKKCPICFDSIYISETRPARLYMGQEGEEPREGSDVVLRLMTRPASSTLALPRDGADALPKGDDIPWYFAAEVMDYVRIMKGTEDYMVEQYDYEIQTLSIQEKEDELMFGEDGHEWTTRAIRAVREAKEKLKGIGGPPANPKAPSESKPKVKRPPIPISDASDAPHMYQLRQLNNVFETPIEPGQAIANYESGITSTATNPRRPSMSSTQSAPSIRRNSTSRPQFHAHHPPSEYYFYQALPHYYLSPLDIRILRDAFGDFGSFPSTILPRVERVSTGHVVDDDLRRRTKYLAHLPYGCEVNFLECDWTDTVPPEVLERFKPEIEKRRKRNADKETREEKARVKAEKEEEDARYSHLRRRRPGSSSGEPERPFAMEDWAPLTPSQREIAGSFSTDHGEVLTESEFEGGQSHSTSPPYPHRQGSGFMSLASLSTSPSTSRTVWGTPAISSTSPLMPPLREDRDDGWLDGWEEDVFRQEEALLAQTQALSLMDGDGASSSSMPVFASVSAGGGGGGGNQKKKKQKKITLMSTTARRGA